MGHTTRQLRRSMAVPLASAVSQATVQLPFSASKPWGFVAAIERRPTPCLPAAAAPEGEIVEATAISMVGSW